MRVSPIKTDQSAVSALVNTRFDHLDPKDRDGSRLGRLFRTSAHENCLYKRLPTDHLPVRGKRPTGMSLVHWPEGLDSCPIAFYLLEESLALVASACPNGFTPAPSRHWNL